MKKLTLENAKEYALEKFKALPELESQWNYLHSEAIIEVLKVLISDASVDKEKLFALAWVHDIGKIKSEENHAQIGAEILKKEFELGEIELDCILNHSSSFKPKTKEGDMFHYADGLSLFLPESINFMFSIGAKEGKSFEKIKEEIKSFYDKYRIKYSESKEATKLLDKLFKKC